MVFNLKFVIFNFQKRHHLLTAAFIINVEDFYDKLFSFDPMLGYFCISELIFISSAIQYLHLLWG